MEQLRWTYWPSPLLKKKCRKVEDFEKGLAIGEKVKEMLREKGGLGLAANQVGLDLCLAVVAFKDEQGEYTNLRTLINPEIVFESPDTEVVEEGCLSFPDLYIDVERPLEIVVRGYLEGSGMASMRLRDFQARIFCHEIDHLFGKPFIERIDPIKREMIQSELDRIEREYGS